MKGETFEKGKPNVKQFVEEYPCPYFIALNDMHHFLRLLVMCYRQWFEMLARLQSNSL
jgi:hypothetical protein